MVRPVLIRAGIIVGVATAAGVLLASVTWLVAGESLRREADIVVHRHERLHFAVHLAAGRVFSVCPCSRGRADMEHWKAARHAPSVGERALVTSARPRRLFDAPSDAARLLRYGAWLMVHDAATRTVVLVGVAGGTLLVGGLGVGAWGTARLLYHPGQPPAPRRSVVATAVRGGTRVEQ